MLRRTLLRSTLLAASALILPSRSVRAQTTPNDPYYTGVSGTEAYLGQMNAPGAWAQFKLSSLASMPPLIDIDTGAPFHTDNTPNILSGFDETGTGIADTDGHATRVCGPACAVTNNNIGIPSIGWGGTLLPVKHANNDTSTGNCLTWILANVSPTPGFALTGVITMPFGGLGSPPPYDGLLQQLWNAGFILFAATGDSGLAVCSAGPCDSPYVIGVSGVKTNGSFDRETVANFGPSLAGTGRGAIISCPIGSTSGGADPVPWTTDLSNTYSDNTTGTSFATLMAGAAARYLSGANPSLTNMDIDWIMTSGLYGINVGSGFSTVPAPWNNPKSVDLNAQIGAALAGVRAPRGSRARRRG